MEIFIILGLIVLNGVLSMSEIALVSARKSKLETDAKKGSKSAKAALDLANNPDVFLSTIQIGITLVGILTGIYSGDVLAQQLAPVIAKITPLQPYSLGISQTLIVVIVTYLTLIIGELVPKRIGMTASERVSRLVARPMRLFSQIGRPFVWLLARSTNGVIRMLGLDKAGESKVTEEEIKAIIQEGTEDGEVQEVEQELVERVFNLGDRNIGSIMTHRSDLIWLDVNASNQQIKEQVQQQCLPHDRIAYRIYRYVGVAYERSPPQVQRKAYDSQYSGHTYIHRLEPVIIIAVVANEKRRQHRNSPQHATEPVYSIERQLAHGAESTEQQGSCKQQQ